jgi:hypothetical protein
MRRITKNFSIDLIAFIGFILLTTTGILMRYILPPGSGHSRTIWGLDRHEWGAIHFWISVIFLGVLAIHFVLHWRWIVNVTLGRPREDSGLRVALGIVGLTGLLAIAISPLVTPVEISSDRERERSISSPHGEIEEEIYGSMTLMEVEQTSGVPAQHVIQQLGLPSDVEKDQRLGQLKKVYGFTMEDVRRVVREYRKINSLAR